MKKLLACIFCVTLIVLSFAGCTSEAPVSTADQVEETKAKTDDELIDELMEDFIDTFKSGDIEGLEKFFAEDSDTYEEFSSEMDFDSLGSIFEAASGGFEIEADVLEGFVEDLFGLMDFEVTNKEIDGDEATVEFEISVPDMDSIDMDSMMTDEFAMELLEDFLKDQGISMEDVEQDPTLLGDEDKFMQDFVAFMMDDVIELVMDAAADADVEVIEGSFELVKEDGEWLIGANE